MNAHVFAGDNKVGDGQRADTFAKRILSEFLMNIAPRIERNETSGRLLKSRCGLGGTASRARSRLTDMRSMSGIAVGPKASENLAKTGNPGEERLTEAGIHVNNGKPCERSIYQLSFELCSQGRSGHWKF